MDLMRVGNFLGRFQLLEAYRHGAAWGGLLAFDPTSSLVVELRQLYAEHAGDAALTEGFRSCARDWAKLNDDRVALYLDADGTSPVPWVATRRAEGKVLADLIHDAGPLPPDMVLVILSGLARALAHAHERSVLLRVFGPRDVTVAPNLDPMVQGFGFLAEGGELPGSPHLGLPVDPRHASPEVLGGDTVDERSDLYVLGLLAFEMLTGRPYLDGPSLLEIIARGRSKEVQRPSTLVPDLPRELDDVVLRLLAPDPELRTQSAARVVLELEDVGGALSTGGLQVVGRFPESFLALAVDAVRTDPALTATPEAGPPADPAPLTHALAQVLGRCRPEEPDALAKLERSLRGPKSSRGDRLRARALATAAAITLPESAGTHHRVAALTATALSLGLSGRPDAAGVCARAALVLTSTLPPDRQDGALGDLAPALAAALCLDEAELLARARPDPGDRLATMADVARVTSRAETSHRGAALLDEALEEARRRPKETALGVDALVRALVAAGRYDEARDRAEGARAPRPRTLVLAALACGLGERGLEKLCWSALDRIPDPLLRAEAYGRSAVALVRPPLDSRLAPPLAVAAARVARALPPGQVRPYCLALSALALGRAACFDEARSALVDAGREVGAVTLAMARVETLGLVALASTFVNRPAETARHHQRFVEAVALLDPPALRDAVLREVAILRARAGYVEEAVTQAEEIRPSSNRSAVLLVCADLL